ncbi:hypothetical protein AB0O67_29680 [Streptomyces sp. NPDC086077]|uniref:hypothetical protein n=1 Tax=Streptomyces sp. NPDC086077 TaxID=3154862 RepID=UPI00343460C3
MRTRTAAPAAPESVSARPRKVRTYDERLESGDRVAAHGAFNGVLHDDRQSSPRRADFFRLDADGRFGRRDTFLLFPLVRATIDRAGGPQSKGQGDP